MNWEHKDRTDNYLYYLFNYIIKNLSSVIYIEVKGQNYYHEILQSLILEA